MMKFDDELTVLCRGGESYEDVEEDAELVDTVAWMTQARPAATGEVATHDEVMYCQKASLVHSPFCLMSI